MKYRVYATVTGSKYIGEFEANSKEEAEEMASESVGCDVVSLCHECSGEVDELLITDFEAEGVK